MVPSDGPKIGNAAHVNSAGNRAELLNSVFGALRAEYFRDELYELFTHPTYFPQLLNRRPCFLVGGRGTGKTTVLKSLSYEGQARLSQNTGVVDSSFIGLYWRIDTSVVRAFEGPELSEQQWLRLFVHYVNLTLVALLLDFQSWIADQVPSEKVRLEERAIKKVAKSLGIDTPFTVNGLRDGVDDCLLQLEGAVNSLDSDAIATTSILGRPVELLIASLSSSSILSDKTYFFLIDEFENLTDYQQRVLNTLVKHAGDHQYTFKIGVREMGHRERATINRDEQLHDPADFALIDIADRFSDASFVDFSRQVCENRLERLRNGFDVLATVDELLPPLTEEAEAIKLGVDEENLTTRETLKKLGASATEMAQYDSLSPLSAYLVHYWSESQNKDALTVLREAVDNPTNWNTRLSNYQHAMLYSIRRRKRGFRKYYSGWSTFAHLADGNIRYLLQLVHEALQMQLQTHDDLSVPLSAEVQTRSATQVGGRIVEQLQGLSANGGDLTRLVLSLGRVFGVMAAQPHGHTPEVSQFRLNGIPDPEVKDLLRTAVMHLALRRFPTDKMASVSGQIKDYSYQLHPIFAPFFVFSYRSKRRMEISPSELLNMVREPTRAIPKVLRRSSRQPDDLPEQLSLFQGYFE